MSIFTLGNKKEGKEISNQRKKKGEERKFPINEKAKKEMKGNSQSKSGRKQKEKKENSQSKNGRKKEKKKRKAGKKAPDQGSTENRRNVQRGLWTGQYLNNTELSPNEQKKEGKETTT